MNDMIGIVGVGQLGGAVVRRLAGAGRRLIVHDVDAAALGRAREAGASVAASAEDVAAVAPLVLTFLPSAAACREVANQLARGKALRVHGEVSTVGPEMMRELAGVLAAAGKTLVDAPVTGGVMDALRGELTLIMAGDAAASQQVADALAPAVQKSFTVGDKPGQAQVCKLVNAAIAFTTLLATCEALAVGAGVGIDPQALVEVVNAGSGRSNWTSDKIPNHILTRTFDAGGAMKPVGKDLDLFLKEATALGMPDGMIAKTRALWMEIADTLPPNADYTNMIKYFERWTGVEVASRAACT